MAYDVILETVTEQPLAAARTRVAPSQIGAVFSTLTDKVWAFLRQHEGLRAEGGHNVFLYRDWQGAGPERSALIDFGVQVRRAFEGEGDVACVMTPAGRVATTLHRGPYAQLGQAHAAVQQWCAANGHKVAGIEWETYGDWDDDPAKLETRVTYLLA
jgi:effector-binding domain-containing protein